MDITALVFITGTILSFPLFYLCFSQVGQTSKVRLRRKKVRRPTSTPKLSAFQRLLQNEGQARVRQSIMEIQSELARESGNVTTRMLEELQECSGLIEALHTKEVFQEYQSAIAMLVTSAKVGDQNRVSIFATQALECLPVAPEDESLPTQPSRNSEPVRSPRMTDTTAFPA